MFKNMLIDNVEIKIKVTNDGIQNNTSVTADLSLKINDVLTSIDLAKQNYIHLFECYMRANFTPDELRKLTRKKLDKIMTETTLNDIFNNSKQNAICKKQ